MKNIKYVLLIIILAALSVPAQIENSGVKPAAVKPKFNYELLNFSSGSAGITRVDAFIQVPYTEVQFVKEGANFVSNYRVIISIYDNDREKLITEKSWSEKLESAQFDQTVNKNNYNLSLRSFDLSPGVYRFRIAVEDQDSRKENAVEIPFEVRNLNSRLSFSDIMLIAKKSVAEGSNRIIPNVSRNISSVKTEGIPLFYEIYSDKDMPVIINYTITDKSRNKLFENKTERQLDSGKTQIFYTLKETDLSLGDYLVNISAEGQNKEQLAEIKKSFFSRWVGIPSNINDIDKAIEQLTYIASESEYDHIEDAETRDEKLKRYVEFWKKKDPTPQTEDNPIFEEYYRRVTYANENFSHYQEGWRTDRGMVFIILGVPSNVERHPFDLDSKPYEVWQYYDLNRSFVFVDETGFGDYRLITPLHGDFYRFR